jgi:hypothetical protein
MYLLGGPNSGYDMTRNQMMMIDGCHPLGGMIMGTSAGEDLDFGHHNQYQNGSDIYLN